MSTERDKRPKLQTLEAVSRHAVDVLLRDGSHAPILIVEGNRGGTVITLQDMAPTHDERLRQMAQAGVVTAQRNEVGKLRQLFFITEAWMSTTEGGQLPDQPPSQDPRRKEILVVSQLQVQQDQSAMVAYEMHRDDEGKLAKITQMPSGDPSEVEVKSPLLDAFIVGFGAVAALRRP
jgi:hypothetical protein